MPHSTSPVRGPSPTLTPTAMTRIVRGCFTESLCDVDFTQALTAVSHLAALDERRKREFCAALRRLNIDESKLEQQKEGMRDTAPAMLEWISSMEDKARKAEALYTQAYIGLRRWSLINEMRLLPFDRRNCLAMLDALYPAKYATLPTPQLTALILNSQRDAFHQYIEAVGKHGRSVLKNLENQSKRPGDANGWPVVHDILERYLKQSNRVLNACTAMTGSEAFERIQTASPDSDRSGRPELRSVRSYPAPPVTRRPSTATGTSADRSPSASPNKLRKDQEEWLAKQRARQQKQEPPRQLKKSRSTLNRLAQEFRRFKSKSADSKTEGPLRSNSALEHCGQPTSGSSRAASREPSVGPSERVHSRANSTERTTPTTGSSVGASPITGVTINDAYRERLIQEAKRNKVNREKRQHSPTHFKLEEERRYAKTRGAPFDDDLDDDRYFFITDSATRQIGNRSTPAMNPYAPPTSDLQIAELAA